MESMMDDEELFRRMAVDLPDRELDGLIVDHFEVDLEVAKFWDGRRAETRPGRYLRMWERRAQQPGAGKRANQATIWMSNTRAELLDHRPVMEAVSDSSVRRVLISGLGIGAVLRGVLSFDHVQHVDVLEKDLRVLELVAPVYGRDPRVLIHQGDVYMHRWPAGVRWDVVWHDVWPDISDNNLPEMAQLLTKYQNRTSWIGFWAIAECAALLVRTAELFEVVKEIDGGKRPAKGHQLYDTYLAHQREVRALKRLLVVPQLTEPWHLVNRANPG